MDEKPREYTVQEKPGITPDVWLTPTQVWEVKAADLSISPVHKAAEGLVHESKGIALRFPRFLRIREDKNPEDATDATQVRQVMKCMWTRRVRPGGILLRIRVIHMLTLMLALFMYSCTPLSRKPVLLSGRPDVQRSGARAADGRDVKRGWGRMESGESGERGRVGGRG